MICSQPFSQLRDSYNTPAISLHTSNNWSSLTPNSYPAQRLCICLTSSWNLGPYPTCFVSLCKVGFFRSQVKSHSFTLRKPFIILPCSILCLNTSDTLCSYLVSLLVVCFPIVMWVSQEMRPHLSHLLVYIPSC